MHAGGAPSKIVKEQLTFREEEKVVTNEIVFKPITP